MLKKLRAVFSSTGQKGQILPLALIFLFVGSLLVISLLTYSNVGIKSSTVYAKKTDELYAADAGIQDAMWQIKFDYLETTFTNPPYSPFDFSSNFTYTPSDNVNGKQLNISLQNIWIPKDVAVPTLSQARSIIESAKLIVTSANGTTNYIIRLTYYPETGENLKVEKLGIWLPRGFSYVPGSSNLEANPGSDYYSVPSVQPYAGNQAVIWSFNSVPFAEFPAVNPTVSPMISEITFRFTSSVPGAEPNAVAWMTTSGVSDIPYSWDSDTRIYRITSRTGSTSVEAYMAKADTRLLRSGIAGDYKATGNSLMRDVDGEGYYREILDAESSSTVNDIPVDATVRAAFLYWSGWQNGVIFSDTADNFTKWNNGTAWSISSGRFRGHYNSGGDPARYMTLNSSVNLTGYAAGTVRVTWDQDEGGTVESSDILYFSFSSDNGTTWGSNIQAFQDDDPPSPFSYTVPSGYLTDGFRMRFYLSGFADSGEYAYLNNITVTTSAMNPDTSVVFKIDGTQVYYSENGTPEQGNQEIIASGSQVMTNYISSNPAGYSYVCSKDVTALIKIFSAKAPDPAVNHPGNAVYTVGSVSANPAIIQQTEYQLAYAGWSLVIVYSSGESKGHSMYLFDTFMHSDGGTNIDFDSDGYPGGTISGFIVPQPVDGEVDAAKLTVFVGEGDLLYTGDYLAFNSTRLWDSTNTTGNSQSNPNNVWNSRSSGMSASGVDIDTFRVSWASGLLQTGATSAQIDLPTSTDAWNLIYMIVSFRSQPRAGGALNYLIER